MAFDLEKELRLALLEVLDEFKLPSEKLDNIINLVLAKIRHAESASKKGAVFMTGAASISWDRIKKGEERPGPSAKPESI